MKTGRIVLELELCHSDVYRRILRVLNEGDKITSENLADECKKLDIKFYSRVNQQVW
ncbi:hypothetical protein ACTXT7_002680 [Hymenolepis weldensis]